MSEARLNDQNALLNISRNTALTRRRIYEGLLH